MGKRLELNYTPTTEGVNLLRERLMADAAKRHRRYVQKRLKEDPRRKDTTNESRIHTLELFFRSQWGQLLSGGIGETIIETNYEMVREATRKGLKVK